MWGAGIVNTVALQVRMTDSEDCTTLRDQSGWACVGLQR